MPIPELPDSQVKIRNNCLHPKPKSGWQYTDPQSVDATIDELVREQALRTPDCEAIRSPHDTITYSSLVLRANSLAYHLKHLDLPSEQPIGILLPRGISEVVAMLGVMMASHSFIVLTTSESVQYLADISKELDLKLVISDEHALNKANTAVADQCMVIDINGIPEYSGAPVSATHRPSSLSTYILSSGSTNKSKIIKQSHRSYVFASYSRNNAIHAVAQDRVLVFTRQFTEIWRALIIGASINVCDLQHTEWNALLHWAKEQRSTVLRTTPTVFRNLLTASVGQLQDLIEPLLPDLRVIEFMGEPVPTSLLEGYRKFFPENCVLINCLGAKEVLDYCSFYVDKSSVLETEYVPAGYKTEGASVLILSEDGVALGPDEEGAIVVRSGSLCSGYGQGITLPLIKCSQRPDSELVDFYVTGDHGHFDSDGCLVFAGRKDSIIKIRGQQVHLLELEERLKTLTKSPLVAVTTSLDALENTIIVAFIDITGIDTSNLSLTLSQSLPNHEIPGLLVGLESMPKTPMGKIDRGALRELLQANKFWFDNDHIAHPEGDSSSTVSLNKSTLAGSKVSPADPQKSQPTSKLGEELLLIWKEVLERDDIGVHDDFLQVGGNSLLAMRVMSRIRSQLRENISIVTVFNCPTISDLEYALTHKDGELSNEIH